MKIDCQTNVVKKEIVQIREIEVKNVVLTLDRETALALCAVMGRVGCNPGLSNHPLKVLANEYYTKILDFYGVNWRCNQYAKDITFEAGPCDLNGGGIQIG